MINPKLPEIYHWTPLTTRITYDPIYPKQSSQRSHGRLSILSYLDPKDTIGSLGPSRSLGPIADPTDLADHISDTR